MPYEQRYVAFFDILGFSDIVKETSRDELPVRFDALARTLNDINYRGGTADDVIETFQFQTFSDSIVMSVSTDETAGLFYLLHSVKQLALSLLGNGLLMRGAVSKGQLHHLDSVMFGPAFLDAYRIEHEIAKYPRIVLGEGVFKDLERMKPGLREPAYILSEDGPPHLDILLELKELNSDRYLLEDRNSPEVIQAQSYQRILQQLLNHSIHEPRHYEKVRWFALYWNATFGFTPGALIGPVTFPSSRNTSSVAR